jgi:hypothetical protein
MLRTFGFVVPSLYSGSSGFIEDWGLDLKLFLKPLVGAAKSNPNGEARWRLALSAGNCCL